MNQNTQLHPPIGSSHGQAMYAGPPGEDEAGWFRPIKYIIDVTVGLNEGEEGRGSIALNDRPFVLSRIKHQIVTNGEASIAFFLQDGLYRIDWSIYEQVRFFKGAVPMADAAYGSVRTGIWQDLPAPATLAGNETIHLAVQNVFGPRPFDFVVQVIFEGVERLKEFAAAPGQTVMR